MVNRIANIDKRGRIAMARVLKESGIKPPVRCSVEVKKGKIIVRPLPKMAERGFGIFKTTKPIGDVDEILQKMKPKL